MKDEGRACAPRSVAVAGDPAACVTRPRIAFITVGDPARLTGGYLYHREVFARLRAHGAVLDEVVAAGASLDAQLAAAPGFGRRFDPAPYDAIVVDALARAVCAPWLDAWRAVTPLVAMVHELPSVAAEVGAGAGPGGLVEVESHGTAEAAHEAPLLRADRLIAVSADGARTLAQRGVDPARIAIASGGLDRLAGLTPASAHPGDRPQGGRVTPASAASAHPSEQRERSPQRATRALTPASAASAHPSERSERSPQRAQRALTPASNASVLTVAQWIPRKGLLELARAWAVVARPGWRLELVGEGTADAAYVQGVRAALALAPAGSVAVRGPLSDEQLAEAYGAASLFALPSRYEGYGLVFAEALSYGLPVVACAAGPVPALVGSGAAILVPAGDEVALAVALRRLMGDAPLRERMASAARARAAELPTWDVCAERFLEAVQSAIALRAGG